MAYSLELTWAGQEAQGHVWLQTVPEKRYESSFTVETDPAKVRVAEERVPPAQSL